MGQFLLWIELVIASVLFVALGQVICGRIGWKSFRRPCNGLWCLMVWVPWAIVIVIFGVLNHEHPIVCGQAFWGSLLAGIAVIIGSIVTMVRAWRRPKDGSERRVMRWSAGKLALGWIVSVTVAGTTFWVMDQFVLLHMASVRMDAASMAMAITPGHVPDSDNAALVIDQAVGMLKALGDKQEGDSSQTLLSYSGNWLKPSEGNYDPTNKQMLVFVQNAQPAVQLLQKAATMPAYDPGTILSPPSYFIMIRNIGDMRRSADVICLSARIHVANGQMDQALAELRAAEALGRHLAASPILVCVLVGAEVEVKVFETYQYLLDQGNIPAKLPNGDWEDKSFILRNQLPRAMQMELAMGTNCFTYSGSSSIAISYTAFLGGNEHVPMATQIILTLEPIYRCFYLENDLTSYQYAMHGYQNQTSLPYYDMVKQIPSRPEYLKGQGPLGHVLSFEGFRAIERLSKADAQSGLMSLSRGLIRYRQANGKYPDSFSDLAPKYTAVIPMDPFSGQPMKMMDKDGRRIIYSIGQDMTDDQGVEKPDPKDTTKGDIVLRLPK